jgi:uncharacterized membrane protein YeaQ/YmgE (transglycosylase-associated protein family)
MLGLILGFIIIGLLAGAVARLLLPGPDPIGILGTIVVGIIGSFVGGFLGYVLFNHDLKEGALQPSGILGSIIGAVIVLLIYRGMSHNYGGSRRGTWGSRRRVFR